jgi:hypothetical protein
VDTVIDPLTTERSSIKRDVFPISERRTFSADALRRARIALAEYARTSGIYDPIDVLAFTQFCIRKASERLGSYGTNDEDELLHEVLIVASASCGVCMPERGGNMQTHSKSTDTTKDEARVTTAQTFVLIAQDQKQPVPVPPAKNRAMPPQPLGDLPDVRPATLWASLLQTMRRSASSLLTLVFVRSD